MNPLINSLLITAMVVLVDIFHFGKGVIMKYFTIFLLILGVLYTMRANAEEPMYCKSFETYNDYIDPDDDMWVKWMMHGVHARNLYERAQWITWYMPITEDSQMARNAFITAMSGMAVPTVNAKICTMILAYLTQYGLDCMEKYKVVTNMLHRAEYHYTMHEFYEYIMEQEQGQIKGYIVIHRHVDEIEDNETD